MKVRGTPQPRTKPEVRSGALLSSGPHRPPARLGWRLTPCIAAAQPFQPTSWPTPRAGRRAAHDTSP
jgi:hypothetical protein